MHTICFPHKLVKYQKQSQLTIYQFGDKCWLSALLTGVHYPSYEIPIFITIGVGWPIDTGDPRHRGWTRFTELLHSVWTPFHSMYENSTLCSFVHQANSAGTFIIHQRNAAGAFIVHQGNVAEHFESYIKAERNSPTVFYVRPEMFQDVSLMYDKCSSGISLMFDKCSSGICLMYEPIRT